MHQVFVQKMVSPILAGAVFDQFVPAPDQQQQGLLTMEGVAPSVNNHMSDRFERGCNPPYSEVKYYRAQNHERHCNLMKNSLKVQPST